MFQLGKLLTQTLISTMPTAAIAANAVANTLANIQYMTGTAFSTTMVTVVGRCVGAREKQQAKRYTRLLLSMNYAALFIMAGLTMLFANPLIGMYDLSAESSTLAYRLILYHSLLAVLVWPVCFTLPSAFRAASDVRFPLVVSMFSMWAFRVALSYCLAPTSLELFSLSLPALGMGVLGVWVAMFVDWLFRFGMYLHRLLTDRWLRAKNL